MQFLLIFFSLLFPKQTPQNYTQYTTAKVDGVFYKAIVNKDLSVSIVLQDGKTVCHIESKDLDFDGIEQLEFTDFNGDGYKDLFIIHQSNVPDIRELLLYSKHLKRFVKVNRFSNYQDPKRIPNTTFYYSYHRSGCADFDWDSDLFTIVNFKIVKIGNISGRACEDDKNKGIFVYRMGNHKKMFVKRFSIQEIGNYKDTKWGFIEDYWKKNYKKFVKSI
jgi:hypothetical protein